ncbi:MAG: hypothetical protein ACYTKD_06585 [Planctomycetota bacterium]
MGGSFLAETARFTAFADGCGREAVQRWWDDIVGQEPESMKSLKGKRKFVGDYDSKQVILTSELGRADFLLRKKPVEDEEGAGIDSVGDLDTTLKAIEEIAVKWLARPDRPDVQRMALGITMVEEVSNAGEGYTRIQECVSFDFMSPGASDFLFRINRPRPSRLGIADLQVNRLVTWSVMHMKGMRVRLDPATGQTFHDLVDEGFAARAEADINTAPASYGKLPQDRLTELLGEFIGLAREIADEGDRP